MRLARKVPAAFGLPELRSFACTKCREAVTVEVRPEAAANVGGPRVEIPSTFQ
ncbi:hypothetical protein MXD81_44735 [Microbacteriaceae bacterium K1510]|nr:hypothetical protein [Microbacteriaceae bacterium K1510]